MNINVYGIDNYIKFQNARFTGDSSITSDVFNHNVE